MRNLGYLLFILMTLYFIFIIRQDIIGNLELKREAQRLVKSISREERHNAELKAELKKLEDKSHIEGLARTRLGMIKKGETAYKVIMD
jgi:cell division protein FtsB